mmetsp:Transcript_33123/g.45903  ORF Transcript_33123/g.45903 Transcript_33123/m.45903 type:complete len:83 (+) Transcript_33123:376-624(+)
MGVTPSQRGAQPKAPEKGVFPLDHFEECKSVKEKYLDCLKGQQNVADACHDVAKEYLECRMTKGLMAEQDLKTLGFKNVESS